MKLNKVQTDAFAKIIKRGMEQYGVVPQGLGSFPDANEQGIIGYVLWKDAEANFTTDSGDTNQEFYITEKGEVCIYKKVGDLKLFVPLNFRAKNWSKFCNPDIVGSEDAS